MRVGGQRYRIGNDLGRCHSLLEEELDLSILVEDLTLVPLLVLTWPSSITWDTPCASVVLLEGSFVECHTALE